MNKNRIKNKILLLALVTALNSASVGCAERTLASEKPNDDALDQDQSMVVTETEVPDVIGSILLPFPNEEITPIPPLTNEEITEEAVEEDIEEEVKLIESIDTITATNNVNIRKSPIDGDILGVLPKDHKLNLIEVLDNGWYKVEYYDEIGYVSSNYAILSKGFKINESIKKVLYAASEIKMELPYSLTDSGLNEEVVIPALECLEVYEEYEDTYFVKTNDYIGYVAKEHLEELTDIFVVIDISDQELRLYDGTNIILRTPVVTGKPSTPSDKGLFSVYNISYSRYLIGPGYKSYVDIMMKYNGGEGLHDAEYHSHDDGFNHGWRSLSEFGGETYLTDGSHGCINMPRDAVMKASEYIKEGTKVLVKE